MFLSCALKMNFNTKADHYSRNFEFSRHWNLSILNGLKEKIKMKRHIHKDHLKRSESD